VTLLDELKLSRKVKRCWWHSTYDYTGSKEYAMPVDDIEAIDWEPVIEKKKKTVLMYQAVFRYNYSEALVIPDILIANKFQARDNNKNGFIKLLTDRPIEIEVEDDQP
jgi:hypothetical protein